MKCGKCCIDVCFTKEEFNKFIKNKKINNQVAECGNFYYVSGKCPLLNDDNSCSIYNERPLVCRAYPVIIDVKNDNEQRIFITEFCNNYTTITKQDIKRGKILLNPILNKMKNDVKEIYRDTDSIVKMFKSLLLFMNSNTNHNVISIDEYLCKK
jgi:Fe-S-cluster containining protein